MTELQGMVIILQLSVLVGMVYALGRMMRKK